MYIFDRCSPMPTLLLLLCVAPLAAQEEQPLNSDRPGFGTGTATVERFQVEGGYTFSEMDEVEEQTIGELQFRIPLVPRLEVRLTPNSYVVRDTPTGEESGFEDANVGLKATLSEGADGFDLLRPAIGVVLNTTVPTGEDEFGAESLQPTATLALGWTLGAGFDLGSDVNVQSLDAGEERSTEISGGATLSHGFGPSLGGFVELYTFAPEDSPDRSYFDGGFTYLLSNDLQLDLNGGVGLNEGAQDFFVGAGVVHRF